MVLRMLVTSVVCAVVCILITPDIVAQEKVEPLIAIDRGDKAGAAPSPRGIERAFSQCLRGIDEEFAAVGAGVARRLQVRKSEEEVCHRGRRECISNPTGSDCRGFVDDYAE